MRRIIQLATESKFFIVKRIFGKIDRKVFIRGLHKIFMKFEYYHIETQQ